MENRTFAEKLEAVIKADPDLTAAGLAVKAGLDNSAIRSILSGRAKNPRVDTAMKICAALGTTLEEFMGNAQTPEEHEILRLISLLPVDLKRQLLTYGQGLADARDQSRSKSDEEDQ